MRAVWGLLVALVVAPTTAAASELDILSEYLAGHDTDYVGGDHCKRYGGHWPARGIDPRPEWTNVLLRDHLEWHREHGGDPGEGDIRDDNDTYGDDFVAYHRQMVAAYDAWRVENDYGPVAAWDPMTPIPPEFAYPPAPGCLPRATEDPKVPLPTWATVEGGEARSPVWGYTSLCEFPSLNRFAKAIGSSPDERHRENLMAGRVVAAVFDSSYHGSVHVTVAGDLAPPAYSPRDPVFWAWHRHVDDLFLTWERECAPVEAALAPAGAPEMDTPREVSSVGVAAAIGACLTAIALRRR